MARAGVEAVLGLPSAAFVEAGTESELRAAAATLLKAADAVRDSKPPPDSPVDRALAKGGGGLRALVVSGGGVCDGAYDMGGDGDDVEGQPVWRQLSEPHCELRATSDRRWVIIRPGLIDTPLLHSSEWATTGEVTYPHSLRWSNLDPTSSFTSTFSTASSPVFIEGAGEAVIATPVSATHPVVSMERRALLTREQGEKVGISFTAKDPRGAIVTTVGAGTSAFRAGLTWCIGHRISSCGGAAIPASREGSQALVEALQKATDRVMMGFVGVEPASGLASSSLASSQVVTSPTAVEKRKAQRSSLNTGFSGWFSSKPSEADEAATSKNPATPADTAPAELMNSLQLAGVSIQEALRYTADDQAELVESLGLDSEAAAVARKYLNESTSGQGQSGLLKRRFSDPQKARVPSILAPRFMSGSVVFSPGG
eukprot:Hpha_TRINITY_DN30175_c0_g1::TRINITY_DN30175_c0_g1_i1::g.110598::m.110598